jgi:hypothetical protein
MDRTITTPHVPVWDKSAQAYGKFSRADFVFDRERNVYVCPAGKLLTGAVDQGRILPYRASKRDCAMCKLKPRCTTAFAHKVSRDIDEDVREQVRALANTDAFQQSRHAAHKADYQARSPFACGASAVPKMRCCLLQLHKICGDSQHCRMPVACLT